MPYPSVTMRDTTVTLLLMSLTMRRLPMIPPMMPMPDAIVQMLTPMPEVMRERRKMLLMMKPQRMLRMPEMLKRRRMRKMHQLTQRLLPQRVLKTPKPAKHDAGADADAAVVHLPNTVATITATTTNTTTAVTTVTTTSNTTATITAAIRTSITTITIITATTTKPIIVTLTNANHAALVDAVVVLDAVLDAELDAEPHAVLDADVDVEALSEESEDLSPKLKSRTLGLLLVYVFWHVRAVTLTHRTV